MQKSILILSFVWAFVLASVMAVTFVSTFADEPVKRAELQDTDLISIVLTVKTAKAAASALETHTRPTADVEKAMLAAIIRALTNYDPGPPPPIDPNQ